MIVDSSPAAAMSRSISAWSTAIGFGCWKKGCGVWCGDERKTTRRAKVARRSTTAVAVVAGADPSQSCVERFRHGEVAGDDFDVRRQRRRRLGAMGEGADRHARVYQ